MILATAKVAKAIKEQMHPASAVIVRGLLEPPVAKHFYCSIRILPDEAFAGIETEDGGNADLLVVDNDWAYQIMQNWDRLSKGEITLLGLQKWWNAKWQE